MAVLAHHLKKRRTSAANAAPYLMDAAARANTTTSWASQHIEHGACANIGILNKTSATATAWR